MRPSAMPDITLRYLCFPLAAWLVACLAAGSWLGSALGQEEPVPEEPPVIPAALDAADAPVPPNLDEFIADLPMAIALGKAWYWDMQAGSDGMTACASCHFQAGADNRMQNSLGLPKYPAGVNFRGANAIVSAADFPFHVLLDPHQPASETNPVLFDSGEIFGSSGVLRKSFVAVQPSGLDYGRDVPDPVFTQGGANCRQVESRHTPSTINAVFYDRNFWDGRANRYFNGVNPFGDLDPRARVWRVRNGRPEAVQVLIDNSSLASQAVGPPMSGVEMSWSGRQFPELGRKLLTLSPLAVQTVHPDDSVLGAMANPNGKGLASQYGYAEMIRQAFQPQWWDAPNRMRFTVGRSKYLLMEINFALFWGLAIQAYETTLVSDDARYDRWQRGLVELTPEEQEGLELFMGPGMCIGCHFGPEFTGASVRAARELPIEAMIMGRGQLANYDSGFYNIGVRPTTEDDGVGGVSPWGGPLSLTRRNNDGEVLRYENVIRAAPHRPTAVDGAFKTPSLRNIELTGPYMHNGGIATLADVVRFYARRPDFFQQNIDNLAPELTGIPEMFGPNVLPEDRDRMIEALVAFMKTLTDERVRWRQAPFDHPELIVPEGHSKTLPWGTGTINPDGTFTLSAVGADGADKPLLAFEEMLLP